MRGAGYDLGIDVRGDVLSVLVLALAGIPRRVGWAMVGLFPPHYAINSTLGMGEAPLLALTLAGLLLARQRAAGQLSGR